MGSDRPDDPTAKRGGRKRTVDVREVLNAIFYVLATGCQWKALPKDLPPKSTAHSYFMLWDWNGTLESIHDSSRRPMAVRRRVRGIEPSALQTKRRALAGPLRCRCGIVLASSEATALGS